MESHQPRGYIAYEGPSRLAKGDIVAIITTKSANSKTGNMFQLWVLAQDAPPTEAAKTGLDEAICGDCPMRPLNAVGAPDPTCYVTLIHGPQQIWKAWKAGHYPPLPPSHRFERPLRMAAYGDPAAPPLRLIRNLASRCDAGWTAYTHQWHRFPALKSICMASVGNEEEQLNALLGGWRTFRVISKDDEWPDPLPATYAEPNIKVGQAEITCPASNEAGKRTTCLKCRLCDGKMSVDRRKNICIKEH